MEKFNEHRYKLDLGDTLINFYCYQYFYCPHAGWIAGTESMYYHYVYEADTEYDGVKFYGNGSSETQAIANLTTKIALYKELKPIKQELNKIIKERYAKH